VRERERERGREGKRGGSEAERESREMIVLSRKRLKDAHCKRNSHQK